MTNSVQLTHGLGRVKLGSAPKVPWPSRTQFWSCFGRATGLSRPTWFEQVVLGGLCCGSPRHTPWKGHSAKLLLLPVCLQPRYVYASSGEMSPAAISASVAWLLQNLVEQDGGADGVVSLPELFP